jgi:hypothetical protein
MVWGTCFGGGRDMIVADNCNTNATSSTSLWLHLHQRQRTARRGGGYVFAGSGNLRVKEIKVFEITD